MKQEKFKEYQVTKTIYSLPCKYCNIEIKGISKKHVKYNLKYHIERKHPNMKGGKNDWIKKTYIKRIDN